MTTPKLLRKLCCTTLYELLAKYVSQAKCILLVDQDMIGKIYCCNIPYKKFTTTNLERCLLISDFIQIFMGSVSFWSHSVFSLALNSKAPPLHIHRIRRSSSVPGKFDPPSCDFGDPVAKLIICKLVFCWRAE